MRCLECGIRGLPGSICHGLTRVWRSPHLAHALWLLVLIKLVTPPIVHIPVDRLIAASQTQAHRVNLLSMRIKPSPVRYRPMGFILLPPQVSPLSSDFEDAPARHREMNMWDSFVVSWQLWLLVAWAIGTIVFISVGVRRHMRLLALIADGQAPDPVLAQDAEQLAQQLGLRACPPLRCNGCPCLPVRDTGVENPNVVLPRRLLADLNRDQIRSILAHELAHIRRRDHWVRIFEVCVLALNWWNPIAWWASRQLRQAEEECCDAWVVWVLPEKRRAYGETLLHTVEYLTGQNVLTAPAGTSFLVANWRGGLM